MKDACAHPGHPAPPAAAVAARLAHAQAGCEAAGQRWTEPRRRVYELLLAAGAPVKAYDLMELYAEGRTAKPPTVYRALEFLEAQGLAHRIASLNAYTSCEGGADAHAASFLICECCGSAEEFQPALEPAISPAAAARGFAPRATSLEVRGLCAACA